MTSDRRFKASREGSKCQPLFIKVLLSNIWRDVTPRKKKSIVCANRLDKHSPTIKTVVTSKMQDVSTGNIHVMSQPSSLLNTQVRPTHFPPTTFFWHSFNSGVIISVRLRETGNTTIGVSSKNVTLAFVTLGLVLFVRLHSSIRGSTKGWSESKTHRRRGTNTVRTPPTRPSEIRIGRIALGFAEGHRNHSTAGTRRHCGAEVGGGGVCLSEM